MVDDRYRSQQYYINRDLSLLAFQSRVLEEARRSRNALLERVKFLSILDSNLEEFFMVRVAGRRQQLSAGVIDTGPDGIPPHALMDRIREEVLRLRESAELCLSNELFPALENAGIHLHRYGEIEPARREKIERYFHNFVYPALTPLALDPARPFPYLANQSLNLAVLLRDDAGTERFGWVKVPDSIPQLLELDHVESLNGITQPRLVWLEDVIAAHLDALFSGLHVIESHCFHITRDAETSTQEWDAADLIRKIEESVRLRKLGNVVKLTASCSMPDRILDLLVAKFELDHSSVYRTSLPLAPRRLIALSSLDRPDLKATRWQARVPHGLHKSGKGDLFAQIRKHDILLHHPYETFEPVVRFLEQAAEDAHVIAIKSTLYRVGRNSPIVSALLRAADKGKQVAAVVELRARFDEESNIEWARALERKGVNVVHGLVDLKVHAKAALVVRREGDSIRRYAHLSTGNYNYATSQVYTDFGILTARDEIGSDLTEFFNFLTGYASKQKYRKLLVGPKELRPLFESLIRREIGHAHAGRDARLIFKVNAIIDPAVIALLYEASCAGVQIDLIVRGNCCLRPGVPGVSENIRVTSIIGRFLEHGRVFYFVNGGNEEIYLGSADLMPRNLNWRVELVFPVEDQTLLRHLRDDVLETYLRDNVNARRMNADGGYVLREAEGEAVVDSQAIFLSGYSSRAAAGKH